jgi:hypothetical protein
VSTIDHPTTINRDYIRLLQVMRRFIREEFTCDIRMTQKDAIEQLLHYAEHSRNHVLQEMGKELQEFVHQLPVVEENHAARVRYYRGAAVAINTDRHEIRETDVTAAPQGQKRIYRGQVIDG